MHESKNLVCVAVAARLLPNLYSTAQVRKNLFEILSDFANALGLGAHPEQLLFEIKIERQRAGKLIGEGDIVIVGEILLRPGERENLAMKLDCLFFLLRGRGFWFISNVEDFAAQKLALLVYLKEFEAVPALSNDIHAAVVVALGHGNDFGSAPDVGQAVFLHTDDPKAPLLLNALANHFLVAGLEDMQRQGRARK